MDRASPKGAVAPNIQDLLHEAFAHLRANEARRALANVRREFALLSDLKRRRGIPGARLDGLTAELKRANSALWEIEDAIRQCERMGDFGPDFVALARKVYQENDKRAVLKRDINVLFGSAIVEEKHYSADSPAIPRPSGQDLLIKCHLDSRSIAGQRIRKFTGGQAFGGLVVLAAALARGMKHPPRTCSNCCVRWRGAPISTGVRDMIALSPE